MDPPHQVEKSKSRKKIKKIDHLGPPLNFFHFENHAKNKTILPHNITKSTKKHVFLMYFFKFPLLYRQKATKLVKIIVFFRFTTYYPKKGIKKDKKPMVRVLVLM